MIITALKIIWKIIVIFLAMLTFVIVASHLVNNYTPKNREPIIPKDSSSHSSEAEQETSEIIPETPLSEFEKTKSYGDLDCQNFTSNAIAGEMFRLINEDRIKNGEKAFAWNQKLCESAKLKTEDMVEYSYFEHVSPSLVTPWHWMEKSGYKYSFSGENLAMNSMTASLAHKGLMNSPGHRANILNGNFTEIGIAYGWGKVDGQDAFFIVEHFGAPYETQKQAVKIICTDKTKAEKNIKDAKKQKDEIDEYLKEADELYDDYKEAGIDTKKIKSYIENLKDRKKELDNFIKANEDYLAECDN